MAFLKVGVVIAALVAGWSVVRAQPQAIHALLHGGGASAGQAVVR